MAPRHGTVIVAFCGAVLALWPPSRLEHLLAHPLFIKIIVFGRALVPIQISQSLNVGIVYISAFLH